MPGRDERIYEEAAALWRRLYDEPPPPMDGPHMLDLILGGLPQNSYDRLSSSHLRASNITFPKR